MTDASYDTANEALRQALGQREVAATRNPGSDTAGVYPAKSGCEAAHLDARTGGTVPVPVARQVEALSDLFALLANQTRLRIVLALRTYMAQIRSGTSDAGGAGHGEWCVCDLALLAGASQSMTSHQLRLLREAGIVLQRREGKHVFYRLSDGPLAHLLSDGLEYVRRAPRP